MQKLKDHFNAACRREKRAKAQRQREFDLFMLWLWFFFLEEQQRQLERAMYQLRRQLYGPR